MEAVFFAGQRTRQWMASQLPSRHTFRRLGSRGPARATGGCLCGHEPRRRSGSAQSAMRDDTRLRLRTRTSVAHKRGRCCSGFDWDIGTRGSRKWRPARVLSLWLSSDVNPAVPHINSPRTCFLCGTSAGPKTWSLYARPGFRHQPDCFCALQNSDVF